jgi:hypothetical protein
MTQMVPFVIGAICVIAFGICVICGSTWTAAGQLYYSMTPETATGPYDLVWNWYDGSGRRFMTHLATTTTRGSLAQPDSTVGFRTYYVYDGNDVTFTLVRPSTGTTWRIQQRSTDDADVI